MFKRISVALLIFSVARAQSPSDSAILHSYVQGAISKDSMIQQLYSSGKITEDVYLAGLSKSKRINQERIALRKLRENARHRFVVDYLLRKIDTMNYDSLGLSRGFPKLVQISDSLTLEAYDINGIFFLYKCPSLSGATHHYLLEQYFGDGTFTMYLFGSDTLHPSTIDSFQVYRSVDLSFSKVDQGNVILITYSDGRPSFLVGIDRNRFTYLGNQ
jgi:hypothetical protein